ncbi:LysE family transporter [Algibacter mikhailovii]|uniref:LysE family transporter n=1 Tax=Algibacter mikhailovii TaxID=425498 RepID=UPI001672DCED|nr:LysE family transporter [Algibacter mikhailovii]
MHKRYVTLVYLFIGLFTSTLGALPLGASNIAVINTTLKENANQAFKIAITAGIAEVILSYYALYNNQTIKDYFYDNEWIQILIAVLLLAAGSILLFKRKSKNYSQKKKVKTSKYATGFLLGVLNPPVLIYWVIAFGIINNSLLLLSLKSSVSILFLFFSGVYLGKILTLYGYSKISGIVKRKISSGNSTTNKVTGILLIGISFIQFLKLYIF